MKARARAAYREDDAIEITCRIAPVCGKDSAPSESLPTAPASDIAMRYQCRDEPLQPNSHNYCCTPLPLNYREASGVQSADNSH
jgi:hypothetical protein